MQAILVWLLAAAAVAMLVPASTRNAGWFAVAGTIMSLFIHYDLATIPEARQVAYAFWAAAVLLLVANLRNERQRRTA